MKETIGNLISNTAVVDAPGANTGKKSIFKDEIPTARLDRPLRVLQVASIDLAIKNLLLPLMKSLAEAGFEVEGAAADTGEGVAEEIERSGFRFHRINVKRSVKPIDLIESFKSIRNLLRRERFDIVHFHTPIAAFIGRIAAKSVNVPFVLYTAHGFYHHEGMKPVTKFFFESLERFACRFFTDYLFCQSIEDSLSALSKHYLDSDKILHIGNGVDTSLFKPDVETGSIVRRELRIPPDAVVVTFIGRMVKEKGVLDLISAFKLVLKSAPDTYLVMAGDTGRTMDRDQDTMHRLKEESSNGELRKKIIFTGFYEHPHRLLTATDIFVLPSYREGVPRTVCEAMSSGVPVIATNIRGPREEIDDGVTGYLISTHSPEELAEKIAFLATNKGKRTVMGMNAREKAERYFDERFVLARQIEVYKRFSRVLSTKSTVIG